MKTLFSLICFSLYLSCFSQISNLVPNGGFEETDSCILSAKGGIHLINGGWNSALPHYLSSTDYWHSCNQNRGTTFENAKTVFGEGFIGFGFHVRENQNIREYAQVKLKSPLTSNEEYCVSYYIKPLYRYLNGGAGAIDQLGVLITDKELALNDTELYNSETPTYQTPKGVLYNDTLNWTEISFSFVAKGNEEYLILGHFVPDSLSKFQQFIPVYGSFLEQTAYYFYDEVQLYKCSDTIVPKEPTPILPNVFTPNSQNLNSTYAIQNLPERAQLEAYNRWGQLVFHSRSYQNDWSGLDTNGTPLPEGVYFVILHYKDRNGELQQMKETVHLFY